MVKTLYTHLRYLKKDGLVITRNKKLQEFYFFNKGVPGISDTKKPVILCRMTGLFLDGNYVYTVNLIPWANGNLSV